MNQDRSPYPVATRSNAAPVSRPMSPDCGRCHRTVDRRLKSGPARKCWRSGVANVSAGCCTSMSARPEAERVYAPFRAGCNGDSNCRRPHHVPSHATSGVTTFEWPVQVFADHRTWSSSRRRPDNELATGKSGRPERSDGQKSFAGEWVDNLHAGFLEVPVIARGDRQTVNECCSCNEAVLDRHGAAGRAK